MQAFWKYNKEGSAFGVGWQYDGIFWWQTRVPPPLLLCLQMIVAQEPSVQEDLGGAVPHVASWETAAVALVSVLERLFKSACREMKAQHEVAATPQSQSAAPCQVVAALIQASGPGESRVHCRLR